MATPSDVPGILGLIGELAAYERAADQVQANATAITALLFGGNTPSGHPAAFCHVLQAPTDPDTGRDGPGDSPGDSQPELAGMALWYLSTSTWTGTHGIHIEDLFVRPQFRGRGYGVALMAELASLCLLRGYARLEWAVLDWNRPAIDFYRSLGSQSMDEWTTMRAAGPTLQALAQRAWGAGTDPVGLA